MTKGPWKWQRPFITSENLGTVASYVQDIVWVVTHSDFFKIHF